MMESEWGEKINIRPGFIYIPPKVSEPIAIDADVGYVFSDVPKILNNLWYIDMRYRKGNKWPRKFYKRLCRHRVNDSVIPCSNSCYKMPRSVKKRRWTKALFSIRTPCLIHKLANIKTDQAGGKTLRMERYDFMRTPKLLENR